MSKDYLSLLPYNFNVGWTTFPFELKKNLKDAHGTPCFGIVDFQDFKIQLDGSMTGETAKLTVIHECFHCLFETMGLGAPAEGEDILTTSNEILTETASRALIMFQTLNPELWKLLFED